jgi:hypothetical protein
MNATPLLNPTTETGVFSIYDDMPFPSCRERHYRQQQGDIRQEQANTEI